MLSYESIPKAVYYSNNPSTIDLRFIEGTLEHWRDDYGLNLEPDFQRGHVWTVPQQIKFLEYLIRGGKVPPLLFNSPAWAGSITSSNSDLSEEIVIVDGLQRLTSIIKFINNELPVFGNNFLDDFSDKRKLLFSVTIEYTVNCLQTRKELLQWYLEMNEGHIAHSQEEIDRVRNLIKD